MKIAKDFIVEMNGEQENFHLEEVVLSRDKKSWEVTYSYDKKIESPNQLQVVLGVSNRKTYKRVLVDIESEEVTGMYNLPHKKREAV